MPSRRLRPVREEDVVERRSDRFHRSHFDARLVERLEQARHHRRRTHDSVSTADPSTATDIVPLSRSIVGGDLRHVTRLCGAQIEPVADERRAQPFGRVVSDDQPVVDDDHTVREAVRLLEVVRQSTIVVPYSACSRSMCAAMLAWF